MRLKEMREKRAKLAGEIRQMADRQDTWAAEDRQNWDKLNADFDRLGGQVQVEERALKIQDDLSAGATATPPGVGRGNVEHRPEEQRSEAIGDRRDGAEYRSMFRAFVRGGFPEFGPAEHRALQADSDVIGGYLVAPTQWVNQLIAKVKNLVFMRGLATVFPLTTAQSLGAPSLETDVDDADWTAEVKTGAESTSGPTFGKRELSPHPLSKRVRISNRLLRVATLNPEEIVRDRLAYKFAVAEENGYLNGNGAMRPLGVFVPSDNGISTARDVSESMTATKITADGLIAVKYALKPQYWPKAQWIFHRDAMKMIRQLKNGDGQYIWGVGLQGQSDLLLDRPINMSEYAPNTFTTAKYVGMLGDFSHYWIADALDFQIQRLVELYAESNQTGFIARRESDGMPVLEEAFVRVKLG